MYKSAKAVPLDDYKTEILTSSGISWPHEQDFSADAIIADILEAATDGITN